MRLLSTIVFFILTFSSKSLFSQNEQVIIGKWKVVKWNDGFVKYDYNTGNYIVSQKSLNSNRGNKDSAKNINFLVSSARGCLGCYFEFSNDGLYRDFHEEYIRSEGSYKFISGHKILVSLTHLGKEQILTYKYKFVKGKLQLHVPSIWYKKGITLELNKSE